MSTSRRKADVGNSNGFVFLVEDLDLPGLGLRRQKRSQSAFAEGGRRDCPRRWKRSLECVGRRQGRGSARHALTVFEINETRILMEQRGMPNLKH